MTRLHSAEEAKSRTAMDWRPTSPAMSGGLLVRRLQDIAQPPDGVDHVDAEHLAKASDKHLDRVGIAVEILVVEMPDDLGARHDPPGMVHQVGEQPVFVRGEPDGVAVDADAPGAGVEHDRP